MPDTKVEEGQLTFPFPREVKLAWLKEFSNARIPGVSARMRRNLSALIEMIEMTSTNDGCRMARDALGERLRVDRRTLYNWIVAGSSLGVLVSLPQKNERGTSIENLHVVNWFCVRRLGQTYPVTGSNAVIGQTLFVDDDAEDGQTLFVDVQADQETGTRVGNERLAPRAKSSPQGETSSPQGETSSPQGETSSPHKDLQRTIGEEYKFLPIRSLNKDPISPSHSGGMGDAERSLGREKSSPYPERRGEFPLSVEMLGDPRRIEAWFRFALGRGWARDCAREFFRLKVFTAARSVFRRKAFMENPEGAFVRIVKRRLWSHASGADEDWAQQAIRTLDRAPDLRRGDP